MACLLHRQRYQLNSLTTYDTFSSLYIVDICQECKNYYVTKTSFDVGEVMLDPQLSFKNRKIKRTYVEEDRKLDR